MKFLGGGKRKRAVKRLYIQARAKKNVDSIWRGVRRKTLQRHAAMKRRTGLPF